MISSEQNYNKMQNSKPIEREVMLNQYSRYLKKRNDKQRKRWRKHTNINRVMNLNNLHRQIKFLLVIATRTQKLITNKTRNKSA